MLVTFLTFILEYIIYIAMFRVITGHRVPEVRQDLTAATELRYELVYVLVISKLNLFIQHSNFSHLFAFDDGLFPGFPRLLESPGFFLGSTP